MLDLLPAEVLVLIALHLTSHPFVCLRATCTGVRSALPKHLLFRKLRPGKLTCLVRCYLAMKHTVDLHLDLVTLYNLDGHRKHLRRLFDIVREGHITDAPDRVLAVDVCSDLGLKTQAANSLMAYCLVSRRAVRPQWSCWHGSHHIVQAQAAPYAKEYVLPVARLILYRLIGKEPATNLLAKSAPWQSWEHVMRRTHPLMKMLMALQWTDLGFALACVSDGDQAMQHRDQLVEAWCPGAMQDPTHAARSLLTAYA